MADRVAAALARGGFLDPRGEAAELRAAAGDDAQRLQALLDRRLTGEPLAWITGTTDFCGLRLRVDQGVYVPRPQTELIARRAAELLPPGGRAIDLCTGCGAIARVLAERSAHVLATDLDPRAVACARGNGVEATRADLFGPLGGPFDLVTAVVPYVPSPELGLLHRDTLAFEDALAYDGGADGADLLRRVVREAADRLPPGGSLLLELGAGQPELLDTSGYRTVAVLSDEDGDVRGAELRRAGAG